MSGRLFGGLGVALALAAVPALAQRTGTRLDRDRDAAGSVSQTDRESAIRVAHAFAQCVAQREAAGMRKALALPFTSGEQTSAITRLQNNFDGCIGTSVAFDELRFSPILSAGAAAEFFLRTQVRGLDLAAVEGMTDEALAKTGFAPRTGLEDLGICIVRADPARARAIIATRVTSREEAAAFRALVPLIGPCVTAGSKVTFNIPNVRSIVAYGLYRIATNPGTKGA